MSTTNKLKYTPKAKIASHRLPFVGRASSSGRALSFWKVPASGDYAGGCDTGEALALIYIKHLRHHGESPGGMLQRVALDMLGTGVNNDAIQGQAVGFFSTIDRWLAQAAKSAGTNLDLLTDTSLLDQANRGTTAPEDTTTGEA